MRSDPNRSKISRREFTKRTGAAALLPLAAPLGAAPPGAFATPAGPEPEDGTGSRGAAHSAEDATSARAGARSGAAADQDLPAGTDQMVEYLRARYPDRLSDEDLELVRAEVGRMLGAGEQLQEVRLANADEPLIRFAAYRGDAR